MNVIRSSGQSVASLAAGLIVLAVAPLAPAAVNVGDKPQFSFTAGGAQISPEKLKGRLVLLDFWATWCGPCVAEAPHMVETNAKYGPKGLQIVGVSLDENQGALSNGIKKLKFTWPQYLDANRKVSQQFGVNGIPSVFLLSPDGTVLWKGHPANMDAAITRAFKEHPPKLVDEKTLSKARAQLDEVEKKTSAGEPAAALKLLAKVPEEARVDEEVAARMEKVARAVEAEADKMLAEVDPLVARGDYVQAVARLKDVSKALSGTPLAAKARRQLNDLLAKPEAREQVESAEKAARADEALAVARDLQKQKKDDLAFARFKSIQREFPDSSAATTASDELKRYESDPAFVKRVVDKDTGTRAKAALSMARSYKQANKKDQARQKYQSIIKEFPNTTYAITAQQELAALGK